MALFVRGPLPVSSPPRFVRAALSVLVALATGAGVAACAEDEPKPTYIPREGIWDYDSAGIQDSTCPSEFHVQTSDTQFNLDWQGGGEFVINPGTENEFDCVADGSDFTCGRIAADDIPVPQVEATLQYSVSLRGIFNSETNADGAFEYEIDCAGADCGLVEQVGDFSFPCRFDDTFVANAQ